MKFTLSDQMLCLGIGFLCGLMLGVLYDLFRFVRLVLFKGRISVFVCDVMFMVCFALVTSFFSMAYSFGKARYFSVFAELAGIFAIRFTLGRFSLPVYTYLYRKIKGVFKKIQIKSKKFGKKLLHRKGVILYNKLKNRITVSSKKTEV